MKIKKTDATGLLPAGVVGWNDRSCGQLHLDTIRSLAAVRDAHHGREALPTVVPIQSPVASWAVPMMQGEPLSLLQV